MRCGYCHNPELVLPERYSDPVGLDEVFSFLESRVDKLQGVVITGGEPTIGKDLPQLAKDIKSMGFKIKLDSNGTNPRVLEQMISGKDIDYIAMDIKGPIDKYSAIANRPINIESILASIKIIKESKLKHEFRTTAVKSQLEISDFQKIGKMIQGAQLYCVQKFIPTKTLDPTFSSQKPFEQSELEDIRNTMINYVSECQIRS